MGSCTLYTGQSFKSIFLGTPYFIEKFMNYFHNFIFFNLLLYDYDILLNKSICVNSPLEFIYIYYYTVSDDYLIFGGIMCHFHASQVKLVAPNLLSTLKGPQATTALTT